jgi:hypothetical protein
MGQSGGIMNMEERNRGLVSLFKQLVQEKSAECEDKFFRKLMETVLWIPEVSEKTGGSRKSFALLMTADGRKFVPAFLNRKSNLGRFTEKQLIEFPYSRLKYLIIDSPAEINGIVIAPFEENMILDRRIMELIDIRIMGMSLRREDHRGKLRLGVPDLVPRGLPEALRNFFEQSMEVEAAWLVTAMQEQDKEAHWMLIIDFQGEKIELFPKVAEVMKRYMKQGALFELIGHNKAFDTSRFASAQVYRKSKEELLSLIPYNHQRSPWSHKN